MNERNGQHARDAELRQLMTTLDPPARQVARMERAVLDALDSRRTSLVQEWLELLRVRPVLHPGLALAAACLLLLTTPLGLLPLSLLAW